MTVVTELGNLNYNGSSVSSRTVTLTAGASVGQRVLVVLNGIGATGAVTTVTVTDTKSNTWTTRAGPVAQAASNTNAQLAIVASALTTALVSGDVITITLNVSPNRWAVSVVKMDDTTGFDVAGSTTGATSTALGVACSSAASQNDQVAVAGFGYTNQSSTLSPAAGWTVLNTISVDNGTTVRSLTVMYANFNTAGTRTAGATLTAGGSQAYAGVITAYNSPTTAAPEEFKRYNGTTWVDQELAFVP